MYITSYDYETMNGLIYELQSTLDPQIWKPSAIRTLRTRLADQILSCQSRKTDVPTYPQSQDIEFLYYNDETALSQSEQEALSDN